MKDVDFFKKGFKMTRVLYCDECGKLTWHTIETIKDAPSDGVVECLKACNVCWDAMEKLKALGCEHKIPVKYQRFFTSPYIFLVLHPHYLEPDP